MKPQSFGRQISTTQSVQAPTGGLNAVDSIAAMPITDAVILDNIVPQPSNVVLRAGYTNWMTGFAAFVESLLPYANAAGEKLFAASGTAFYNATTSGAVGSAVVTGLTNARWESTNIATPAGQFMYAMNGVDKPEFYDGTNWVAVDGISTPAITGVTTTKLRNPVVWKNRLWAVENASLNAWYMPVQSIGGAASKWDLTSIFSEGGFLQSIMPVSIATASDFDDYLAFMTSEGQIAIYGGTDPATAGLFVIQGVYKIGKPIGRRCFFKAGADVIIICSDGLVSLSNLVRQGRGKKTETISYKIQPDINTAIQSYGANFGWQGVLHPLGNKIIINVPVIQDSTSYQYVQNTLNQSWCTYGRLASPWNAACFCVLGDILYWGGATFVAKGDFGVSDAGNVISGSMLPAFSYFKTDRQKLFTMIRPLFTTTGIGNPTFLARLCVDFSTLAPTGAVPFGTTSYAIWDTSKWDVALWATGLTVRSAWQSVAGLGFVGSAYIKLASKTDTIQINSCDYVFMVGGVI